MRGKDVEISFAIVARLRGGNGVSGSGAVLLASAIWGNHDVGAVWLSIDQHATGYEPQP
ncbi:hypothetical protein [Chloroflexus sp.]|uniref:hypothetical protein n=1 Tax=Chloroflexus sp. TaxID=1904827 RepID=UPI003C76D084